jgi:hypothetical protein
LQDLKDRDPVDPGRFHGDRLYAAASEPIRQSLEITREGPERSHRFFVAIRANGCHVHGGADINCRRGWVNRGQTSRFARSLRLRHAMYPPA